MTSWRAHPMTETAGIGTGSGRRVGSSLRSRTEAEFQAFYHQSADGLHRALALALGDVDLAQEATDEAMARAFQRWRQIRRYDSPAGWVYRVGLNWARGRLRQSTREVLSERPLPHHGGDPGLGREPVGDPAAGFDHDLRRALSRLTVEARAVVVCRYLLGWSTAETAGALNLAEGTVKSRLSRALSELERMLDHE